MRVYLTSSVLVGKTKVHPKCRDWRQDDEKNQTRNPFSHSGDRHLNPVERKEQFETSIDQIIEKSRSTVTFSAIQLDSGEILNRDADRPMSPASAIKVMHLVELMCRAAEGVEDLAERVEWLPEPGFEYGGGSGVIQFLKPGLTLTLWDLAVLMIIVSDNQATQMLYDRFGPDALDGRAASIGIHTTFRETGSSLGGKVTPMDMARLMAEVGKPTVIPTKAAELCLKILKYQQYQACLSRYLPDYTYGGEIGKDFVIGYKAGYSGGTRTDFGVCFSEEANWSIAVMVDDSPDAYDTINPTDRPGVIAIARISRLVHDYFRSRLLVDPMQFGVDAPDRVKES